jgi:hypothetical protein
MEKSDPELFRELSQKRSLKVKDPAKQVLGSSISIDQLPAKAVKQIITPSILHKDKQACQDIV